MANRNLQLKLKIQAAGVAITDVSIGDDADRTTWRVTPSSLQAAAQPVIDGFVFNENDSGELNLLATGHLDNERIFSALVWAILDTYSAPATVAKYTAARTKIIAAFKTQPWKSI
jgi:hypothetical protein